MRERTCRTVWAEQRNAHGLGGAHRLHDFAKVRRYVLVVLQEQAVREVLDLELRRLERDARAKLQDVGHLLGGRPEGARRALEALLDGSITVTPTNEDGARFHLTGRLVVGSLAVREGDSCGSPKRPYVDEFRTALVELALAG